MHYLTHLYHLSSAKTGPHTTGRRHRVSTLACALQRGSPHEPCQPVTTCDILTVISHANLATPLLPLPSLLPHPYTAASILQCTLMVGGPHSLVAFCVGPATEEGGLWQHCVSDRQHYSSYLIEDTPSTHTQLDPIRIRHLPCIVPQGTGPIITFTHPGTSHPIRWTVCSGRQGVIHESVNKHLKGNKQL